ncbi:MAG: ABC transporter permease, partial [Boseongicola sp.]
MSEALADSATTPNVIDSEEQARLRARKIGAIGRWALPIIVLILAVGGWHFVVAINEIPHYILPGPGRVVEALITNWGSLIESWLVTMAITGMALLLAVTVGVGLAVLFNLSKWVEMSFFPYAVVLQVTPIIAVAP